MKRTNERNKILTVTDCYGWKIAQAFLTDLIASDEDNEKRLEKAHKEAIVCKLEKQQCIVQEEGRAQRYKGAISQIKRPR